MRRTSAGCWLVDTPKDIRFFAHCWGNPYNKLGAAIGLDVETKPLKPGAKQPNAITDTLVGVGISFYDNKPDDLNAAPISTFYGLATDEFLAGLKTVVAGKPWYAHNAMFDAMVLRQRGIVLGPHIGDPRIIAYLLGEPEAGLKVLLNQFGLDTEDFQELLEKYGAADISEVPIEAQADYCGLQDAEKVVWLERQMRADLIDRAPRAFEVYTKVELPMVPILVEMSYQGIRYDREAGHVALVEAQKIGAALDRGIAKLVADSGFVEYKVVQSKDDESACFNKQPVKYQKTCSVCRNGSKKRVSCHACNGRGKLDPEPLPFNAGSWQQRERFLYDFLKVPRRRFSGGVKPWQVKRGLVDLDEVKGSTDQLAMLQVQDQHPAIPLMLSRNRWKKDEGFLKSWANLARPYCDTHQRASYRLHTTFTNTTVVSGRLSSRNPNLTQVPLAPGGDASRSRRSLFIADEGTELVSGDMSQLELVIMAYASRDPVMIEAINNGWDMHRITAEAVYGIPWRDIPTDSPMRATAKVANYLTGYGGKKHKLIEGIEKLALMQPHLGLAVPDEGFAAYILGQHRRKYKVYWQWVRYVIAQTRERGYSETVFGRPRFFEDINNPMDEYRTEAERAAVNHVIQGTAADLMKQAMVNISRDRPMSSWGSMLLQVHDEIVSCVQAEHVLEYGQRLKVHLELDQPFQPIVPLTADVLHGPDWSNCHK